MRIDACLPTAADPTAAFPWAHEPRQIAITRCFQALPLAALLEEHNRHDALAAAGLAATPAEEREALRRIALFWTRVNPPAAPAPVAMPRPAAVPLEAAA